MKTISTVQELNIPNNLRTALDNAARFVKSTLPGSAVMLFGSYARGEQKEDSDIDLCVLVPELTDRRLEMTVNAKMAARKALRMPMDILLYTYDEFEESAKKKSRIQYHIKNEGVMIDG